MDFSLNDDQQALVDLVDRITQKYDRRYYLDVIEKDGFYWEAWRALADAGCMGICVPKEQGGLGLGLTELCLVMERLSERGVPLLMMLLCPAIAIVSIARNATEAQRERFLPPMMRGDVIAAFAITEPEAGTNSFKIKTFAEKVEGGYRLNGEKMFITGFDIAERAFVVARTRPRDPDRPTRGMSLFMLDTKSDGITMSALPVEFRKPEKQFMVYFDNVFVPEEDLIGADGDGLKPLFDSLNPERLMVAAMLVGYGKHVLARGIDYANQRTVFDGPIGAYQSIQHPLALAHTHLSLARLQTYKAARDYDEDRGDVVGATMAKLAAADAGLEAADAVLQLHGGNGFVRDYDLIDIWKFMRLHIITPVSRQMALNQISQNGLGLPKSY